MNNLLRGCPLFVHNLQSRVKSFCFAVLRDLVGRLAFKVLTWLAGFLSLLRTNSLRSALPFVKRICIRLGVREFKSIRKMSKFIPFKSRVQGWTEKSVLLQIDVRKVKLCRSDIVADKSKCARLERELRILGDALSALRTRELFPDSPAEGQDSGHSIKTPHIES